MMMQFKLLLLLGSCVCMLDVTTADNVINIHEYDHKINLPTNQPLNTGHRGSSGILPEHTTAGYEQAIEDGADLIECDITITKDQVLVCLHDPFLSQTTDIENHPEFTDRKKKYRLRGKGEVTDWFTYDFTLAELKTLRVKQKVSFRDQSYNGQFNISTFDEHVAVAQGASRPVGIYPELKQPSLINSLDFMDGTRVEDLLLISLTKHGYTKPTDPCLIQCFEEASLIFISDKTELPLLIATEHNQDIYGSHLNESRLQEWGEKFYGIIAWKTQVTLNHYTDANGYKNWISGTSNLISDAKAVGLKVHLFTFRNEDQYLAWNFKQDPKLEYEYYMALGVDGYFSDFPATFRDVLTCVNSAPVSQPAGVILVIQTLLLFICTYL